MRRRSCFLAGLFIIVVLSACAASQNNSTRAPQALLSNEVHLAQRPTATPRMDMKRQIAPTRPTTLVPTRVPTVNATNTATTTSPAAPPTNIPGTGLGTAPYGAPPPMTAEEIQLTQLLFAQINSDRAVRGLYPYTWNATLAGGARLHSWNMVHCGFSHTCPDGRDQCQRIADEGFAGYTDCGECIGMAGPYPTPWGGVYNVQESMINEPPTGWHRIHLTSTTLHRVGVGIYVDSRGWIWFTEDLVS